MEELKRVHCQLNYDLKFELFSIITSFGITFITSIVRVDELFRQKYTDNQFAPFPGTDFKINFLQAILSFIFSCDIWSYFI